mmetsp:Transcript_58606/g.130923  ORF Transcript_58606/g.130923 Transcript_58606/m.130923 type:complete len:550 (+) Transcript_58606:95-1744(+)
MAYRLLCVAALSSATAAPSNMRGSHVLVVEEVRASLQQALQDVLRGGAGSQQLEKIEGSIWQTYQALPKNEMGHIGPRAVRYLVHNYFAKEHGWLIKGLEPHGHQAEISQVHEVNILQDKAPMLVETLLEAQHKGRGLSLVDTVAMVATLERLIFDEAILLLQAAYQLNSMTPLESLDERAVHEVMVSYLVLFEMGQKADLDNVDLHLALKARAAEVSGNWPLLVEFEQDSVQNYLYANKDSRNPFTDMQLFAFDDTVNIVETMAQGYGKWQNTECQQMKQELMDLDHEGRGLVPLGRFYSQPENAEYHFTETRGYLKQIGALQESSTGELHVRIANYMTGPSNCIASSSYYSVCCLNECESLMNELEARVLAPSATPSHLFSLVGNMSSATVDAPRQIPTAMEQKLHSIATQHGGTVPLHGRLFAQWMHYAFPNECPYPQIAENASVLTPSYWEKEKATVSKTERAELAEVHAPSQVLVDDAMELAWTDQEMLVVQEVEPPRHSVFRMLVQLALLLGLLHTTMRNCSATIAVARATVCKKKSFGELPF